MSIGQFKLSAYIAYLQEKAASMEHDPDICYSDWMVRPEIFSLANGEVCIGEERSVTADEANGIVAKKA